jgi:hypothetical protein
MFKKFILILIFTASINANAVLVDNPLGIVLVGSKDQVMTLVSDAMTGLPTLW